MGFPEPILSSGVRITCQADDTEASPVTRGRFTDLSSAGPCQIKAIKGMRGQFGRIKCDTEEGLMIEAPRVIVEAGLSGPPLPLTLGGRGVGPGVRGGQHDTTHIHTGSLTPDTSHLTSGTRISYYIPLIRLAQRMAMENNLDASRVSTGT